MKMLKKRYEVPANTSGYFFRKNVLEQKWTPGYYYVWDLNNKTRLYLIPTTSKLLINTNQEVLTKDNIALRFSFSVMYKITDGEKMLQNVSLSHPGMAILFEAEQRLINIVHLGLRDRIAQMESQEVNEKRGELSEFKTDEMEKQAAELGITIEHVQLRDLTFPKSIQDLFAKHLEAKIRAKAEFENARTVVATARSLKNASDLVKDDDNIKFFQVIEAITKIADKGKHTFMIGDILQLAKGNARDKTGIL